LLFTVKHTLTAAKIYEDALELAPNRLPLLHNLAKTRMTLKDAPEGERRGRRVLSIDDRSDEAWAMLAWAVLFRRGDPAEALDAAEHAMQLAPAAPRPPALKEQGLRRCGRAAEADALWSSICLDAANSWEKARGLMEAYYWLDLIEPSRAITMAYTQANPDSAEGLKDLSSLLMAEGDFKEAQEVLLRATAAAPDHRVIRMVCGLNAFRLGDFAKGLDLYSARWYRT